MPPDLHMSTPLHPDKQSLAAGPTPPVRLVIPAFRACATIRDVVTAVLHSQHCSALEVVVVDDGCNGDLPELLRDLPVQILDSGRTGSAAAARNRGAAGFEGQSLVFIDADVVVDPYCIARLLEPLQKGLAEATVGNYSKNVAGTTFASRYKQLYISRIYERRSGYIQSDYWSAACAIHTRVFRKLNGFDEQFRGACGEDVELGQRMTRAGHRILAVPDAIGDHRNVLSPLQLIRNDWRKGLMTMRTHLHFDGSIVDNRHSTARDVRSVVLAVAALMMAVLSAGFPYSVVVTAPFLAAVLALYLVSRADLLRVFASQGARFVVKACAVMYLLDLVRFACVVAALWLRFPGRKPLLPLPQPVRPRSWRWYPEQQQFAYGILIQSRKVSGQAPSPECPVSSPGPTPALRVRAPRRGPPAKSTAA